MIGMIGMRKRYEWLWWNDTDRLLDGRRFCQVGGAEDALSKSANRRGTRLAVGKKYKMHDAQSTRDKIKNSRQCVESLEIIVMDQEAKSQGEEKLEGGTQSMPAIPSDSTNSFEAEPWLVAVKPALDPSRLILRGWSG